MKTAFLATMDATVASAASKKEIEFYEMLFCMMEMLFLFIFIKIGLNIFNCYFFNSIFTNINDLKWFNTCNKFELTDKLTCKCKNKNENQNTNSDNNNGHHTKTIMCKDRHFYSHFRFVNVLFCKQRMMVMDCIALIMVVNDIYSYITPHGLNINVIIDENIILLLYKITFK